MTENLRIIKGDIRFMINLNIQKRKDILEKESLAV